MRDALAERLLATVMNWGPEDVARERPRLQALASFKYDEYQQFAPGERFVERLARWLSRLAPTDRAVAYHFVLERLVFISNAEMQHFIGMAYRDRVRPLLVAETAAALGVPQWRLALAASHVSFRDRARRCLILGLSDGARLDIFRRSARKLFTTEQFFASYEVPDQRCKELQEKLTGDVRVPADEPERFHTVILLDDFAGSGRSLVKEIDGVLSGKIVKFLNEIKAEGSGLSRIVDQTSIRIVVLYYVASAAAVAYLNSQLKLVTLKYGVPIRLMTVHTLAPSIVIDRADSADDFVAVLGRNYDASVEDTHTRTGGSDMLVGYANGGLPLILAHNTPNNAPSLLWYERDSRPPALFPRVTRHIDPDQSA